MSNYDGIAPRERRKSLFIVEGNHEKNELMEFLLMIFPEIDIKAEDIIIYGTNIYMLYEDIVKEYHEDWDTQDIDLPFVVSKKKGYEVLLRKDDIVKNFEAANGIKIPYVIKDRRPGDDRAITQMDMKIK